MIDRTILYYSANVIHESFASAVRARLLDAVDGRWPIVSVTQAPVALGQNVVVGPIGASIYNVYQQLLAAARLASTPVVACAEDDTLYAREHFEHDPPPHAFTYDHNRWVITRRLSEDHTRREAVFYLRRRTQLAMLVCSRDLLIDTLEERFERYPWPVGHAEAKRSGWGEPGRYEKNLGLRPRVLAYYEAAAPSVTFNHRAGLMGRRQMQTTDAVKDAVEPWGSAEDLWRDVHGEIL